MSNRNSVVSLETHGTSHRDNASLFINTSAVFTATPEKTATFYEMWLALQKSVFPSCSRNIPMDEASSVHLSMHLETDGEPSRSDAWWSC